jgi:HlyD family secretion protein
LSPYRKRVLIAVAGLLVLGTVVTVSVVRDRRSKVAVQTQKAARKDLTSIVSASGEVRPKRFVNVSANVSGRITRLSVKEGDVVKNGQVLAQIDAARFEAETRQSRAALESARADLDRNLADLRATQLAFERTKQMYADKLVSDQANDQAEADLKVKQAMVESQRKRINQLEAALESFQDTLEKATVPSPMDGVVTSLQKEEGEVVIGAQSFQPTIIMTVADLSIMEVEVLVDETDIRNVKLGQEAEVRVDAFEGSTIKGEVTEIGSSAIPRGASATTGQTTGTNTSNQAKDFKVTVTLKDPPSNLRPGLNATADVVTARKPNVLSVPIQSVVVRELDKEGNVVDPGAVQAAGDGPPSDADARPRGRGEEKEGVFVVSKGQALFRPVKTGIIGETEIEVLDGLAENDEIVSGSYRTLRTLKDKARIKLETKKKERS